MPAKQISTLVNSNCAQADFGRTANAVNNAVAKTRHIPLVFTSSPPRPTLGYQPLSDCIFCWIEAS